ncbi:immunity 26/phosphotriesterase HocA family protein [Paenibacillus sp. D2_2]|uniref:immunity 26/phosphotriesterase HocA family protein n=1 Tax=Paenibacillus sp. D2_2 TaxID=3073092 RepID=UPI002814A2E7|nr:immunity 26/phosphotriesterase HocA family protein [Paenibacillus sp. D2_2]WMT39021.1 immunity 26/phosphotriesterase HocA family protein [Paenibacillus sp. D2_2]
MMQPFDSWLTNTLRPFFGLLPLEEAWDILEIREGYFVCMDGDIIRKRISVSEQAYQEDDVHILTRNREVILPLTARGKEKKMNYTHISAIKADGILFSAGIHARQEQSGYILARNPRTYISLPLPCVKHLTSKMEIIKWLEEYPSHLPADYDLKLDKFKNMKSLRYKSVPGDIFRVEIDLFTDGYVLVVGDLRQMQKDGLFTKDSLWNNVMTMPLFIRTYLFKTADRSPTLDEITSTPLSERTWIVMDDHFMRGGYEKVGHKPLTEADIQLPIGYGRTINYGEETRYRLSWGTGTVSKAEQDTSFKSETRFSNYGVSVGVSDDWFNPVAEHRASSNSLEHPLYHAERTLVLAEFGLPEDISYDEFNRQTGGLTRAEYLEYLAKTYSRTRK